MSRAPLPPPMIEVFMLSPLLNVDRPDQDRNTGPGGHASLPGRPGEDKLGSEVTAMGAILDFIRMVRPRTNLWDNARFILADVPVDPAAARKALPLLLRPSDPPRATLFIADYTKTSFTVPYREAALLLHVRHPLGAGLHCPWMTVDDDTALIYGRELLGYPKKFAQFEFVEEGDTVRASVSRRGVKVMSMAGVKGAPQAKPLPVFDVKTFNVGGPASWFVVNPIWLFRPREVIHESREMKVEVSIHPSEWDPIAELIAGPPDSGRFVAMDIVNSRYNLIAGLAGPAYLHNNFNLRFR
jgi:acetoacetate decarboxylase